MCAYNAIDGAPACANTMLLRDHLRDAWHFDGYVVSDCAAVADVNTGHHYRARHGPRRRRRRQGRHRSRVRLCEGQAFPALVDAVHQNLITEAELDTALRRLFRARFRLGMFDPPSSYAYGRIPFSEVNSPEHRQLSLQAARESMVLLKNQDHILPLKSGIASIAVIGPTAELVQSLQGNYNGPPPSPVYSARRNRRALLVRARRPTRRAPRWSKASPCPSSTPRCIPHRRSGDGLTGEYFDHARLERQARPHPHRPQHQFQLGQGRPRPRPPAQQLLRSLDRQLHSARTRRLQARRPRQLLLRLRKRRRLPPLSRRQAHRRSSSSTTGERGSGIDAAGSLRRHQTPHPSASSISTAPAAPASISPGRRPRTYSATRPSRAAQQSDVIIAFVGLSPSLEGEEMPVNSTASAAATAPPSICPPRRKIS